MRSLDPMQQALIKNQFKLMIKDIGFIESLYALAEILKTAEILSEVMVDEKKRQVEEGEKGQME